MRIGFFLSHCHFYGSSKYILEVSKYLSKRGHEVHIIANTFDEIKGVIYHKMPSLGREYSLLENGSIFLLETLYAKVKKFDITFSQPGRFWLPDICHVRFVTQSALEMMKKEGLNPGSVSKIFSKIEKLSLKKCKHVIAMTEFVKNELVEKYRIDGEKISVVYDGVDAKKFTPHLRKKYSKLIREKHGIEKDDKILLFVGNPFSRKGLHYLISSLRYVSQKENNFKLLILGKSLEGDPIEKYLKLAEKHKVKDKIIYGGFSREVHKYFSASDVFVFPTLYEPFGLVILEAMASGLPVITSSTRYCGAAELIEDHKEGILLENPRNPIEISEKILYLLENRNMLKKIGRNAHKKAKKYTWKRTAEGFLRVFEGVL